MSSHEEEKTFALLLHHQDGIEPSNSHLSCRNYLTTTDWALKFHEMTALGYASSMSA